MSDLLITQPAGPPPRRHPAVADGSQSKGTPETWSTAWATQTQKVAIKAFKGLIFSAKHGDRWTVMLPGTYEAFLTTTKKEQLTRAGARLAQVLEAVWPE